MTQQELDRWQALWEKALKENAEYALLVKAIREMVAAFDENEVPLPRSIVRMNERHAKILGEVHGNCNRTSLEKFGRKEDAS